MTVPGCFKMLNLLLLIRVNNRYNKYLCKMSEMNSYTYCVSIYASSGTIAQKGL